MHELDMEFFFFFTIFRRGRIVILSLFMDFHVISFSSFLDLSLIKHGFFFMFFLFFPMFFNKSIWLLF